MELTSTQVSRAAQFDTVLEQWRTRPLGVTPYLLLDARYEKVRIDGQVRDAAFLITIGVTADGKRTILGISVSVSEQEAHWRQFLQSLLARGLRGNSSRAMPIRAFRRPVWPVLAARGQLVSPAAEYPGVCAAPRDESRGHRRYSRHLHGGEPF